MCSSIQFNGMCQVLSGVYARNEYCYSPRAVGTSLSLCRSFDAYRVRIGLYCSWTICCRWLPLGTLLKAKGGGAWCNTTMKEGGSYNGLNDYLKFGIGVFCDWRAEALG